MAKNSTGLTTQIAYASPEVITSEDWSLRADVFSFGLMVLEIFTEQSLFNVNMDVKQAHDVILKQTWKTDLLPLISDKAIVQLVEWCCNMDKNQRPSIVKAINHIECWCFSASGMIENC